MFIQTNALPRRLQKHIVKAFANISGCDYLVKFYPINKIFVINFCVRSMIYLNRNFINNWQHSINHNNI
jgi:hypothetical protein